MNLRASRAVDEEHPAAGARRPASRSGPAAANVRGGCFGEVFGRCFLLSLIAWLLAPLGAQAQWKTQSFLLKPGWNAVYLHVDPSHTTLDGMVAANSANPITEVWAWEPNIAQAQFFSSPQQPITGGSQWRDWNRPAGGDALLKLYGNVACLVRNGATTNYTWRVKGKPVPPRYRWTDGANFIGFPTPETAPPVYDAFLTPAPDLRTGAQIYYYPGGEIAGAEPNSQRLFALLTQPVTRGQAFWIRAQGRFNRYFGPFEVALQDPDGIGFGASGGQYRLRLKNLTTLSRTVRMQLLASEAGPDGITPALPTLLVRGTLNLSNLTYGYTTLNGTVPTFTLPPVGQPGAETEIVLGLNRSAIAAGTAPGTVLAGLVQFSDTTGLSQIDVPVSAAVADTTGLWVGAASVTTVQASLKSYARATNAAQFASVLASLGLSSGNGTNYVRDTNTSLISVTTTNGVNHYLSTNFNTANGGVSLPFPLRLIVHSRTNGTAQLLQQVFFGVDANTNAVLALRQSQLHPGFLAQARRITAPHLPWTESNTPWGMSGTFARGQTLSTTNLVDAYDDQASNPFLHTYHPDHDNLNATFDAVESIGVESYNVERRIQLSFTGGTGADFASLTAGSSRMDGLYLEEIRLKGRSYVAGVTTTNETRSIFTSGGFVLNHVSNLPKVTAP